MTLLCTTWKGRPTRRLHLGDMGPCLVVISPTAESLAIACQDGSVYVVTDAAGNVGQPAAQRAGACFAWLGGTEIGCLVFSPDGRSLAVVRNREIHLLPVPAGLPSRPPEVTASFTPAVSRGPQTMVRQRQIERVNGHATRARLFAMARVRVWRSLPIRDSW